MQATFAALQATYDFLTPDLWQETRFEKNPLQEFTDFLAKPVGHCCVFPANLMLSVPSHVSVTGCRPK